MVNTRSTNKRCHGTKKVTKLDAITVGKTSDSLKSTMNRLWVGPGRRNQSSGLNITLLKISLSAPDFPPQLLKSVTN